LSECRKIDERSPELHDEATGEGCNLIIIINSLFYDTNCW